MAPSRASSAPAAASSSSKSTKPSKASALSTVYADNTLLGDIANCDTLAVLRHVYGLRMKDNARVELAGGHAVDAACNLWMRGGTPEACLAVFDAEFREPGTKLVEPGDRWSWDNLRQIMWFWLSTHPLAEQPFEIVSVQDHVGFTIADGYEFWGMPDAVVRWKASGELLVMDTKSSGNMDNSYWQRSFRSSSQLTGYTWLLRQLTGQPIMGSIINAIEVRKVPGSDRRCSDHGVKYSECGVEHCKSAYLGPYLRDEQQMQQWHDNALALMRRLRKLQTDADAPGEGTARAAQFPQQGLFGGHCRFCEFEDWCLMGRPVAHLKALTEYDPWGPWRVEQPVEQSKIAAPTVSQPPTPPTPPAPPSPEPPPAAVVVYPVPRQGDRVRLWFNGALFACSCGNDLFHPTPEGDQYRCACGKRYASTGMVAQVEA